MYGGSWKIFLPLIGLITASLCEKYTEQVLESLRLDPDLGHNIDIIAPSEFEEYRDTDFKRCTVQVPGEDRELEYYPEKSHDLPKHLSTVFLETTCSLHFSGVRYDDIGKWNMRFYVVKGSKDTDKPNHILRKEFTIRIVTKVEIVPKDEFSIVEGNDLYIQLKDPVPNMTDCSVRSPDNTTYTLWNVQNSKDGGATNEAPKATVEYWGTSPENGHCGTRIRNVKNTTASGTWHIETTDAKETIRKNSVRVYVEVPKNESEEKHVHSFTLGEDKPLDLTPKSAVWCRARSGAGELQSCKMDLFPVKRSDAKTWLVTWTRQGSAEVYEREVEVVVYEQRYINATVEKFETDGKSNYNLLCSMRRKPDHCIFERPDGKIFSLQPGIGTGRYSYYGKGFAKSEYDDVISDCGLTIENAQAEDNGAWKCMLSDANEKDKIITNTAFLPVGPNIEDENIPHSSAHKSEAFVGGNLKLSCWARASLGYCLLQHPNGTALVNESTSVIINDLRAGYCGLQLYNVTANETGQWSCRMGIPGRTEISTAIDVTIYDDVMISTHDSVTKDDRSANISCRTVNKKHLSYCRFVRPDGFSIHSNKIVDEKYKFSGVLTNGECNLTVSSVTKEDHGTWKCSGGLLDVNRELTANHRLRDSNNAINESSLPITLIILSSCALFLAALMAIMYKYRSRFATKFSSRYSRNSLPKPEDPVPYYLPADSPVEGIRDIKYKA